jgi:hypothetical protein
VPPRFAVDAGGRVSLQCVVRRSQAVDVVDVVQQRGEPLCPIPPCCLTYSLDAIQRMRPALGPGVVTVGRVPLGQPASLHPLRGRLFGGFVGTPELSDFPRSSIIAVRPKTSRCGLRCSSSQATVGSPGSRTRCVRACTGSSTARGPGAPRDGGASDVAFRLPIGHRHPGAHRFRGSIPGLHVPLSTLRRSGLPLPTHDSGPLWVATPSTSRTCIDNTAPVLTGAHRNHLGTINGVLRLA